MTMALVSFSLQDIDPDILSQESGYSSALVELPVGITAFFNPASLKHAAFSSLLSSQPTQKTSWMLCS